MVVETALGPDTKEQYTLIFFVSAHEILKSLRFLEVLNNNNIFSWRVI